MMFMHACQEKAALAGGEIAAAIFIATLGGHYPFNNLKAIVKT